MVFGKLKSLFGGAPAPQPPSSGKYLVFEPADPAEHVKFPIDRARMFDLAGTRELMELLAKDESARDDSWLWRFHRAAWNGSVVRPPDPWFEGPDGFTYLRLNVPEDGESFDSNCLSNLAHDCLNRGAGAVFFAHANDTEPGFVLPMGVIDSMMRLDDWRGDPVDLEQIKRGPGVASNSVLVATPNSHFVSPFAARALHRFLYEKFAVGDPRVALIDQAGEAPSRSLMVNRRFEELGDHEVAGFFCNRIKWFLPPTRTISLMPSNWKEKEMVRLADLY